MNYPTIAQVQVADLRQLFKWARDLPAPQTDVERTVHRRIERRLEDPVLQREAISARIHADSREIGRKWDDLISNIDKALSKVKP